MENPTIPSETAEKIEKDLAIIVRESKGITITNEEENYRASEFLSKIKGRKKRLEELRTSITKPLNDALKATNNRFKMFAEPLDEAEQQVKWAIGAYAEMQEKIAREIALAAELKRKEEADRLEKEAEAKRKEAEMLAKNAKTKEDQENAARLAEEAFKAQAEAETAMTPVEVAAPKTSTRTESGMVFTKKVWTFEIVNEAEIPRFFLEVNSTAIRKAITGGEREIKGIRIYQETQVVSK